MTPKTLKIDKEALSTREKAKRIVKAAAEVGAKELDFSEVEFVSRSFADEVIEQADKLDIDIVNLRDSPKKVFNVIEKDNDSLTA